MILNVKKVFSILKHYKHEAIVIFIGFIAMILVFTFYNNYKVKQIEKAKQEILLKEQKEKELKENAEAKIKLEKNNKEIFFIEESKKIENQKNDLINKIKKLEKELEKLKNYDKCLENQIIRLVNSQEVDLDFCKKNNSENIKTSINIKKEEIKTKPKKIENKVVENINLDREILFLCQEVGAKDPYKCATYGTLVYNYESGHGNSRRCTDDNNCYGIKNPTDKAGLKGKYEIGTGNHLIFETKEMGAYAFAYYYSKYHYHRNANNFVNRWAGWNNEKYIAYINNNYNSLYNKYQNFLTFSK